MNETVNWHLKNIKRINLLTRDREVDYGRRVQRMISLQTAKKALTVRLKREPTLAEWGEYCQISPREMQEILDRGWQAKQKMIEANLRLVVKIAKEYQNRGLELSDLIQEGSLGLHRGVEKFDPKQGCRLSTYCSHWIRQGITRAIATSSRCIQLTVFAIEKLNLIKKVRRQLSQQLGSIPTLAEIAKKTGLSCQKIAFYLAAVRPPASLNLNIEDDTELGDLIEDARWEQEQEKIALSLDVDILMEVLLPQQRQVLSLRYGLKSGIPLTCDEAGKILACSGERVRLIEKQAFKTIRSYLFFKEKGKSKKYTSR